MADSPEKIRFGGYWLYRRLARGGMAELFLASPAKPGQENQRLVIKRMLPQFSQEEEFLGMFLEEARLASQLTHPSIVRIFDLGLEASHLYIAMEYIEGKDLGSVTHGCKQALPATLAAKIAVETLSALAYAHEATGVDGKPLNIVHRDVTPENLMLTRTGGVKLVDFGVAKATAKLSMTRPGIVKGKLSYMAPEYLQGKPLDGRADLFSLGATLYAATTGKKLFERPQPVDAIAAILNEVPPSPEQVVANYPPRLAQIVMRALEKDRERRFASAKEMKAELEQFLARNPPVTPADIAALVGATTAAGPRPAGEGSPPRPAPVRQAAARASAPPARPSQAAKPATPPPTRVPSQPSRPPQPAREPSRPSQAARVSNPPTPAPRETREPPTLSSRPAAAANPQPPQAGQPLSFPETMPRPATPQPAANAGEQRADWSLAAGPLADDFDDEDEPKTTPFNPMAAGLRELLLQGGPLPEVMPPAAPAPAPEPRPPSVAPAASPPRQREVQPPSPATPSPEEFAPETSGPERPREATGTHRGAATRESPPPPAITKTIAKGALLVVALLGALWLGRWSATRDVDARFAALRAEMKAAAVAASIVPDAAIAGPAVPSASRDTAATDAATPL